MLVHGVFNLSSYGDLLPGGRSLRFTMPLKLPIIKLRGQRLPDQGKESKGAVHYDCLVQRAGYSSPTILDNLRI